MAPWSQALSVVGLWGPMWTSMEVRQRAISKDGSMELDVRRPGIRTQQSALGEKRSAARVAYFPRFEV
jgi:hypothetical protein